MSKHARSWLLVSFLAALPAAAAAQTGTVRGTVSDATTGQPLSAVQVFVVGTALNAVTNQAGEFVIASVPSGERQVQATLIGYTTRTLATNVGADAAATVEFRLDPSAVELGAVVVTATGREQTKREIGSSVALIDPDEIALAPITSFSDLVQGRSAGVVVLQSSGTTGAGSRIRIRGNNSISLSNAPLLVIDGVRVESDPSSLIFEVGGQQPSRFDDLNPENIESIEILKGPAASALYGTAAANGVIQVITKKGTSGEPRFRFWAEYGQIEEQTDFPVNVRSVDADGSICHIALQAQGACTPVETYRHNPLESAASTPFETGARQTVGGSASGGGAEATYYIAGEWLEEDGIYTDGSKFGDFDRSDVLERFNLRANLSGNVGDRLRVTANAGYVESDLELQQADNALFGLLLMGLGGNPTPSNVENNFGYFSSPAAHYDWITHQALSRFTGSLQADYRPLTWLNFNGSAGLDRNVKEELNRIPREAFFNQFGGIFSEGWIQVDDVDIYSLNTNLSGTAIFDLSQDLVSSTTLGSEYIREDYHEVYAFGATLTPGVETSLAGATTDYDADEENILNATVAVYAQQQLSWRDRLFVNGAVRGDKNTAFGSDIGWIWYPSISGSWVVSQEAFFPQTRWLSNLRLRAAFGQAGLRPGPTDALQSFEGEVSVFQGLEEAGIVINEIGNPELEPERSTEWELGFEAGLIEDRFGIELSYFDKTSKDALVNRPLPPSVGSSQNRFENLGRVDNSGLEVMLNGQLLQSEDVTLDFRLSGSWVDNELVDLGQDAQGSAIPPIIFGLNVNTQRHAEGFPLGSWFQSPIASFDDADGDGLLSPEEVVVGVFDGDGTLVADSAVFMGNPFPSREVSLSTGLGLWDWLRISALFDYKGGHELINFTRWNRCIERLACEEVYDPATPLALQAAFVASREYGTLAGFVEDADFVKFRELAVRFRIPSAYVGRFADELSLTLAGRNLATWTDYSGFDPEVNYDGQSNFNAGDAQTLPANRILTVRIDASF